MLSTSQRLGATSPVITSVGFEVATRPRRRAALWLLGLVLGVPSCAPTGEPDVGTLAINLVGQAPSGTVYRLRHAVITVTGQGIHQVWNTEDDLSRTSLSEDVPVGDYAMSLAPSWNLERIDGTSATPVAGALVSANPASFTVTPHRRTAVPLRFHVDSDVVDMSQGYDIVLTVEESPPQLIVVGNFNDFESGSLTIHEAHVNGDAAPLRTIAGPLTTLSFPIGITVTDDEIIVCDADTGAIDVFPIHASGDVAPSRQIVGPETGIDACSDVAVFNGELYVAQSSDLLVFPLTANGDAAPIRRITGFSSGQYLAIHQGELYMADSSADRVAVFPLPVADHAQPIRSIESNCASGVALAGGELFVANGCHAPGEFSVYPRTANGSVEPQRTLSGDRADMGFPGQIRLVRGELYVASEDRVFVYRGLAAGDAAPVRTIGGPNTGVSEAIGLAVR
jgi:hypothetical protein